MAGLIAEFLTALGADVTAKQILPGIGKKLSEHVDKRYLKDESLAHLVLEEIVRGYPGVPYPNLWERYKSAVDIGHGDRMDRAFTKIATITPVAPIAGQQAQPQAQPQAQLQLQKDRIKEFLLALEQFPLTQQGDKDFEYTLKLLETNRLQEFGKKIAVQGKKLWPHIQTVADIVAKGTTAVASAVVEKADDVLNGTGAQEMQRRAKEYRRRSRKNKL